MWNFLKNNVKELVYKTELDSQTQKTNLSLLKGNGGRINWEIVINRHTSLYKTDNQRPTV